MWYVRVCRVCGMSVCGERVVRMCVCVVCGEYVRVVCVVCGVCDVCDINRHDNTAAQCQQFQY